MQVSSDQTLAQLVTRDHRLAVVFEKYQLDFCCRGKVSLETACAEKGLDPGAIALEIERATETALPPETAFTRMTAEQLIGHIILRHHFYIRQTMPQLFTHLQKVAQKHGERFPWMMEVWWLFARVREELEDHLNKEEQVLFPAIRAAGEAWAARQPIPGVAGMIRGALEKMESEHEEAGYAIFRIRELTSNYEAPAGACTTFRLALAELREFEEDLHRHVHLENHVLFPMAQTFIA